MRPEVAYLPSPTGDDKAQRLVSRTTDAYARGMRTAAVLVVLLAVPALGDDRRLPRPDVEAIVPVPPYEHDRLHWYDGRLHHLAPGTVTINGKPYVCDLHRRAFGDRDRFVAHLRIEHHLAPAQIPDTLVIRDGEVHFAGK